MTGACGFVGCNLVEHLLEQGRSVVAVDLRATWPPDAAAQFASLPGRLTFVAADVLDASALARAFAAEPIDGVIHAAAITPGPEREARDAELIMQVNLLGTLRVLAMAREHGVRRLVYPSSASVYGDAAFAARPLDESRDAPVPNALYGIAKYAAEGSVIRARSLWGMDAVAARVGAVFGPWEHDTGLRDTFSGPMLATRAMRRGEDVILTREGPVDWVYALDAAAALVALLDAPALDHPLYNVSSGRGWSLSDWCRALQARLSGPRFQLTDDPERATLHLGPRDRAPLAVARLHQVYQPRFGLEEALTHYLAWLERRSRAWLEAW